MSQRVAHGKRDGCSHGREEVPRRSEPRGRRAPPRLLAGLTTASARLPKEGTWHVILLLQTPGDDKTMIIAVEDSFLAVSRPIFVSKLVDTRLQQLVSTIFAHLCTAPNFFKKKREPA